MQYSLYTVAPKVYLIENKSEYDLGMLFCRAQEFYENSSPLFRGKQFSLFHFMEWYSKTYSETGSFTYPSDFSGFNIPGHAIFECYALNIDHTPYDKLLFKIVMDLASYQGNSNFYLIGIKAGDQPTCKHEKAHAYFYTDLDYKYQMSELVKSLPNKKQLFSVLTHDYLYHRSVCVDETQAYMATGLVDGMEEYTKHRKPFIKVFKQFDNQFDPKLIEKKNVDLLSI